MRRALIASAVLILLLVGMAFWDTTEDGSAGQAVPGGHTDAGRQAIAEFGCGTCHTIPGVTAADGRVGPPWLTSRLAPPSRASCQTRRLTSCAGSCTRKPSSPAPTCPTSASRCAGRATSPPTYSPSAAHGSHTTWPADPLAGKDAAHPDRIDQAAEAVECLGRRP